MNYICGMIIIIKILPVLKESERTKHGISEQLVFNFLNTKSIFL